MSVPLDLNFMLGSYTFSLQATIDHHEFSMYNGHCATSVYCCEKSFLLQRQRITLCDMNHTQGSFNTYIMNNQLLVEWIHNHNTDDGNYFLPWCWNILSISLNTGRGMGTENFKVDKVFPPDDLWFASAT